MGAVQIVATVIAAVITAVAVTLVVRAVQRMISVIRLGQPDPERFGATSTRLKTMLTETLGHTRMLRWSVVGAAHWFVMVAFIVLSLLVLAAYFEVVDPAVDLPVVGGWLLYGLVTELIGVFGLIGIVVLIVIRLLNRRSRPGSPSRFLGSTMWQAYFVEYVIVAVLICGFLIRGLKAASDHLPYPVWAAPVSRALGAVLPANDNAISVIAAVKIVISMVWVIVIALNVTMGVAWHRFTAFFNIFFQRQPGVPGSCPDCVRPM